MKRSIPWKGILIFILILIMLTLSACKNPIPGPAQIEDNAFVLVVGIDKGIENPENVRLTILSEKSKAQSSSNDKQVIKSPDIRTSEARTIYEAERTIRESNENALTWGHIKYILVSEDVAKDDLLNFIDLFTRDWEVRLNKDILIVKNYTAEKFINMSADTNEFLPDVLDGLLANNSRLSITREIKLLEAISVFDNPYIDAYLPSVSIEGCQIEGKIKNRVTLDGFAVFKGRQLFDFLTNGHARGINWITDNIESTIVLIKESTDKYVSLVVIDSTTKLETKFKNDLPETTINIRTAANIGEQLSHEDIYTESNIIKLEKEYEETVKREVESVLTYAQSNSIDIFGFGDKIYHQHPLKWKKIRANWKHIFSKMKIDIKVDSKVKRSYLLKEPIGSTKGE